MKHNLLFVLLLLVATPSFAKRTYTMTRNDFQNQFNENSSLLKVYCHNEKGEKVWLYCNNNTMLTISLNNKKTEDLMLHTIKLKNDTIEAVRYNVWWENKKVERFSFNEVTAITIERKFQEGESPYFNADSGLAIVKQKNDSLNEIYSKGSEFVILLINTKEIKGDTLSIIENACYNLTFKDGVKTEYGVVQKITKDSIYVSNFFNAAMASKNKKNFELLGHPVSAIKEVRLLKAGGYSYNTIQLKNCTLSIINNERTVNKCPYWFAVDASTGGTNFYRLWKTDRGFSGITEKNGHAVWYEGEKLE